MTWDIRAPLDEREYEQALRLMHEAFFARRAGERGRRAFDPVVARRRERCRTSRELSRIAVARGRVIGHVGVVPYAMRVGSGQVSVAGIHCVVTHPRWRMRGVADALMRETLGVAASAGFPVGTLYGIPKFYVRYGFVSFCPQRFAVIERDYLPEAPVTWRRRRMRASDASWALPLYERVSGDVPGSSVRRRLLLDARPPWDAKEVFTSGDGARGYVIGGISFDGRGFVAREYLYEDEAFVEQMVRFLGREVRARGFERAVLWVQPNVEIREPLLRLVGRVEFLEKHWADGGPMIRLLDEGGAIRAIEGALRERVRRARGQAADGQVTVRGRETVMTFGVRRGQLDISIKRRGCGGQAAQQGRGSGAAGRGVLEAGPEAAQLYVGYRRPPLSDRVKALPEKARGLIDVLFPPGEPFLYWLDQF